MNTNDGRIYSPDSLKKMKESWIESTAEFEKRFKPMVIAPTPRQLARKPPKVGHNEPCPCGSGRKFKRCCLR